MTTRRHPRLAMLEAVYRLYDRSTATLAHACRKECRQCCTANVTLTTLEADYLFGDPPDQELVRRLTAGAPESRFRPALSLNQMAAACAAGRQADDPVCDPDPGPCALLHGDLCRIYARRPMGCRCMWSTRVCRPGGAATLEPFVVTLNQVFLQVVEHLDVPGCQGNLADVAGALANDAFRRACRTGRPLPAPGLIANHRLSALPVPPEHRRRIRPLVAALVDLTRSPPA